MNVYDIEWEFNVKGEGIYGLKISCSFFSNKIF